MRYRYFMILLLSCFNGVCQTVYKDAVGELFPVRSFVTIDGEKIDSSFLKNKIVVYNFYFEACYPCRVEMSGLNQLHDKYKNDETVFIAITPDNAEKAAAVREKYGLKYKIISLQGKEIAELNNRTNYPTNLIVDKEGKIAFKESGTVIPEKYTILHVLNTFGPIIEKLQSK